MITRIYAHSAAERRHGSPNQAIDCIRTLAVQQYLFLRRHHGLRPGMARDRLYQILFIGVTGGRYVPSTTAVHRPVEAVIGARRIEDNASTGATGEVGGWQFDGPEILDEVDEFFDRLASSPFVLNDHVSPDAIEARLPAPPADRGRGMKPAQVPAAREIVMRRTDDVQVVIEPRAIGLEVAAQVYGQVCAETIRRLQDEEGFPCVRYGTRRLVPVAAADAWLAARAERDTTGVAA